MATEFQKFQHLEKFLKDPSTGLLRLRNDVQVLRDRINAYVAAEGGLTEEQKAAGLIQIEQGSQGIADCSYRIGLLADFVDAKMSGPQKAAIIDQAEAAYGKMAKDELLAIFSGLKSLKISIAAVRSPAKSTTATYSELRADMAALVAEIDAIPYVEIGAGPVA